MCRHPHCHLIRLLLVHTAATATPQLRCAQAAARAGLLEHPACSWVSAAQAHLVLAALTTLPSGVSWLTQPPASCSSHTVSVSSRRRVTLRCRSAGVSISGVGGGAGSSALAWGSGARAGGAAACRWQAAADQDFGRTAEVYSRVDCSQQACQLGPGPAGSLLTAGKADRLGMSALPRQCHQPGALQSLLIECALPSSPH